MFQSDQPQGRWRTVLLVCLALLGLAFGPKSGIIDRASDDQTIYSFQRGIPAAISNFLDLEAGCNWTGIGGQVFDQAGMPVTGLMVKISGILEGRQILHYVYTGSSQHFGSGGYDLQLADHPVSSFSLKIQLLDAAGASLSRPFFLHTWDTCQQNLLVVNLTPISLDHSVYLPQVYR